MRATRTLPQRQGVTWTAADGCRDASRLESRNKCLEARRERPRALPRMRPGPDRNRPKLAASGCTCALPRHGRVETAGMELRSSARAAPTPDFRASRLRRRWSRPKFQIRESALSDSEPAKTVHARQWTKPPRRLDSVFAEPREDSVVPPHRSKAA